MRALSRLSETIPHQDSDASSRLSPARLVPCPGEEAGETSRHAPWRRGELWFVRDAHSPFISVKIDFFLIQKKLKN